ncbi:MAG: antiterminator LoaP [Flexilinea sp.]|nr:antiterminator LoaP [Flexilinea sp.]
MWYVLWTTAGSEEKTREMINTHVDHSLFTRCLVPYRKKREFHGGESTIVRKLLFSSYVFVETESIREFAERMRFFPGKNVVLSTGHEFCPIYREEEYFLTKLTDSRDVIDISRGYMDGNRVKVISGPLSGFEDRIRKVNWRQGLAVLQMNLFYRTVDAFLGLDRVEPLAG